MSTSQEHFNTIADNYDGWKQKNWYYLENLKKTFQSLVPPHQQVLEIGCGTGHVLGSLRTDSGHGIDISEEMIRQAKHNYKNQPHLTFEAANILNRAAPFNYDVVIIPDVIGHIEDLQGFMSHVASLVSPGTPLIVSTANALWTLPLEIAEKLRMKTPEGPHWWLSAKENERVFKKSGFKVIKRGYRFIVPKKIPGADWVNNQLIKNPWLARLGLGVWWILEK